MQAMNPSIEVGQPAHGSQDWLRRTSPRGKGVQLTIRAPWGHATNDVAVMRTMPFL